MTKWGVIAVIAAFIVTIFADWGAQMTGFSQSTYALKINGEEVSYDIVDRIVQDRVQKAGVLTDSAQRELYRNVIDEIVYEKLAMQEAKRLGMSATEQEIVLQTRERLFRTEDGNFDKGRFDRARRDLSSAQWMQYEKMIGDDITLWKIFHATTSAVVFTPQELDDYYNLRYQRAGLRHILIRPGDFIPEYQAMAFYEAFPDSFMIAERVKGRHILFRIPQNAQADVLTDARARAEFALVRLQGGASFDKLYADAKGDTSNTILAEELDWFTRGQKVPAFDSVAFTYPTGRPTPIIQTQFGFHIALFDGHEMPHREPFEEVSERIRARLSGESELQQARTHIEEILKRIEGGESFEALARQFSSGASKTAGGWLGDVIPGEMTPELYPDTGSLERIGKEVGDLGQGGTIILHPAISKAVFDLEVGKTSEILLSGHGYHIVRIERRRGADPDLREQFESRLDREYRDFLKRQLFRDWQVSLKAAADIEYSASVESRMKGI